MAKEAVKEEAAVFCSCGECLFPASPAFCSLAETARRLPKKDSSRGRQLLSRFTCGPVAHALEVGFGLCLLPQFLRSAAPASASSSKRDVSHHQLLTPAIAASAIRYATGNLLPRLVFPWCSCERSLECLECHRLRLQGEEGGRCECSFFEAERESAFAFLADRLRALRQFLGIRCTGSSLGIVSKNSLSAWLVTAFGGVERCLRFHLLAEVLWGARLFEDGSEKELVCKKCGFACAVCGTKQLGKVKVRTGKGEVVSEGGGFKETSAFLFSPGENRVLLSGLFGNALSLTRLARAVAESESLKRKVLEGESNSSAELFCEAVPGILGVSLNCLDETVAAFIVFSHASPPHVQNRHAAARWQQTLQSFDCLVGGKDGWKRLPLCKQALHLVSLAAQGNVPRLFKKCSTLPLLLQCAVYRHIDAWRAFLVVCQIESSVCQMSGRGVLGKELARQLDLPSAYSASEFLLQLPHRKPESESDANETKQSLLRDVDQDVQVRVRLSRRGQVEVLAAFDQDTLHSACHFEKTGSLLRLPVIRNLLLLECVPSAYKDSWRRLPPPSWLMQSLPVNRRQLREWIEFGGPY